MNRHRVWCLSVTAIVFSASIWSSPIGCQALSASSSKAPSPIGGIFGKNSDSDNNNDGIAIELFDPTDERTLGLLQECRRTAFAANKENFLDSERDFVAAKSVVDGRNLCAIALDTEDGTVVGSADLAPKMKGVNVITNVFVRPDQRGKGLGRRLMVEGIEGVLANNLPPENRAGEGEAILSLDVYTHNTPAFKLYEDLGYEPSSAIHSGTLALANAINANLVVKLSKTVPIGPEQ
jgi:GNAT superfamily N-acetyltransferase